MLAPKPLEGVTVSRIAFTANALPAIRPVSHVVDQGRECESTMKHGSGRRGAAMSRSFKGALIGVCVVGFAMASAPPASANFPHFQTFSVTTVDSGSAAGTAPARTSAADPAMLPDLLFTWTEVGLGKVDVTYDASAVVTATFGCVNGGSNQPKATNKTTITAPVSATVQLSADDNGRIAGSLDLDTAGVEPVGLDCPSGQVLMAISASFTQITLTDVTNHVSVTADDITVILLS
jgi:hypothetical protein